MYTEYQKFKTKKQPTGSDVIGPYYKENAPERNVLTDKPNLTLSGKLFDTNGNLIHEPQVLLDFWQADADGIYDMKGHNFRGKLLAGGTYEIKTVHPGDYLMGPNEYRCSHIHFMISCEGYEPLTTQLYFPVDPYNATDPWFNKSRVIKLTDVADSGMKLGNFDFVLAYASKKEDFLKGDGYQYCPYCGHFIHESPCARPIEAICGCVHYPPYE